MLLPEIRADDLLLRPWRPADAEAVHRACQDPVLAGWSRLPVPFPRADADRFVADMAAAGDTAVPLAVCDSHGTLLGSADLRDLDRGRGTAELAYWTAPWARGGRVAERASRALLGRAFGELGLIRVDWRATVGNHASRLTGLRLGFRMLGVRPADARRPEEWLAALVPADLTPPGHDVAPAVRQQAAVFGGAPPTLAAGPVTLRPPAARDAAGLLAAYRDPAVVRWYGVPDACTEADVHRYLTGETRSLWARGEEAVFVVSGPGDEFAGVVDVRIGADPEVGEAGIALRPEARGRGWATAALRALTGWGVRRLGLRRIEWRADVGNDASRRTAERAGFTIEGVLRAGGRRGDIWVGSVLAGEVTT